jgi:hypothetical protein
LSSWVLFCQKRKYKQEKERTKEETKGLGETQTKEGRVNNSLPTLVLGFFFAKGKNANKEKERNRNKRKNEERKKEREKGIEEVK